MDKTLIVTLAGRQQEVPEFKQTLQALRSRGAIYQACPGWSDVAEGRSVALSIACNILREMPDRNLVLCLDDDMAAQPSDVQDLINAARLSGEACSAVYASGSEEEDRTQGKLAGCQMPGKPGRWLVGLGCLAIPRDLLLRLEQESEPFKLRGQELREFTWSAAEKGEWWSEDYRLCSRLGGVRLLPIAVGHKKPYLLWPDDSTLVEVRRINEESERPADGAAAK